MSIHFVGRERELKKLNELYATDNFQMAVIYGRRRVGKTTLINQFCKDKPTIFCVGIESTAKNNLENFSKVVWKWKGLENMPPFLSFEDLFSHVATLANEQRLILVIDEYPYLAKADSSISSIMQMYIDHSWKNSKLFLILCGSSMSFMEHQVLGYKSPLYGRRTAQFKISAFDYRDSSKMLPDFSKEEQAIFYGVTGGIPEYLKHISPGKSVRENLVELLFDDSGRLFEEPSNLLKQELRSPATYNAILTAIASGCSKQNEISTKVGIPTGGCSNLLTSLIELGIVVKEKPVGEISSKKTIYQIADQMFRFWYQFVGPNTNMITAGYGDRVYDNFVDAQLSSFMGKVFERMSMDYLIHQAGTGQLPFFFNEIGSWWGGNPKTHQQEEIDIVAIGQDTMLLGECKWKNSLVEDSVLRKLVERSALFPYERKYFYLFSKSGYTHECSALAKALGNVTLVEFKDM